MPAAERSSNVCMPLVLDSSWCFSPFAVCVQIDLGLRFWLSSLLLLAWLRDADSFILLLRCRFDLLARGWGSAFQSADNLEFLDGSPSMPLFFFLKMNFKKVWSVRLSKTMSTKFRFSSKKKSFVHVYYDLVCSASFSWSVSDIKFTSITKCVSLILSQCVLCNCSVTGSFCNDRLDL